jgi:hypothetical protein
MLPRRSSNLPGSFQRKRAVPMLPYLVLLRRGFAMPSHSRDPRCALTAPFHPYLAYARRYLSVALSVASPRLDVIQPAARGSSDFPLRFRAAIFRPTSCKKDNTLIYRDISTFRCKINCRKSLLFKSFRNIVGKPTIKYSCFSRRKNRLPSRRHSPAAIDFPPCEYSEATRRSHASIELAQQVLRPR